MQFGILTSAKFKLLVINLIVSNWIFFQCRHATHGELNEVNNIFYWGTRCISDSAISDLQPCVYVCVSMRLQGTVCWMCLRALSHCQESCQVSSTAWTSSASRYLERSLLIAPTLQTAATPVASYGARRMEHLSVPPKTAVYPGLTARHAQLMGPACMGSVCPLRRWCNHR